MHDIVQMTRCNQFAKFCSANATDASYPSKIATTTTPTGGGVVDLSCTSNVYGTMGPSSLLVIPFGTGSDNNTFKMRLYGWRYCLISGSTTLYIPTILCAFTCTLSAAVGVASATLVATERFADTLTADAMNPASVTLVSNALDTPAHFVVDVKGFTMVEATFDRNSSATACNALYATY